MDYFHITIIGAISGTLSMILVYIYLYFLYRNALLQFGQLPGLCFYFVISVLILECSIGNKHCFPLLSISYYLLAAA